MTETLLSPPPVRKYGTFNIRMLASVVDLGLVAVVTSPLIEWVLESSMVPPDMNKLIQTMANPEISQDTQKMLSALWALIVQQHMLQWLFAQYFLDFVCVALYTLPFWFRYSSTPGKMLFGYTIRDAVTGERMTREQAVKRFLAYVIAFLPLTLGFVWIIFNKKRQGLHDILARTVVIKKPKELSAPAAS